MWGYVVIDCIVCDMIKSKTSLCMSMCMFNIILWILLRHLLWYLVILWVHIMNCVCLGFELVLIGVWYNPNSVMDYSELFDWSASVKPDQNLVWYYSAICLCLWYLDTRMIIWIVVLLCILLYHVMCLECFMGCYSVFTNTYPIDCSNSYLLYGAAFMLVLCGSPLTVTWG